MMIYKNAKLRLLKIFISGIKFNSHVCDKNVETKVIMIRETKKKLEKEIGCKFLEDATIVNRGFNNIRFREDRWDCFFLTALSNFTGKYSRN